MAAPDLIRTATAPEPQVALVDGLGSGVGASSQTRTTYEHGEVCRGGAMCTAFPLTLTVCPTAAYAASALSNR